MSDEVLAEFRERLAPYQFAAQHPGSFSYFTPPPLPISIVGEVLAAVDQPGRRRLARRHDRAVRRGGGHPLAVRPAGYGDGRVGRPHLGRRHGERHGPDAWPATSTCATLLGLDRAAARGRPRGRRASTLGPGALLDRARRRHPGLPGGRRSASCRRTNGSSCAPAVAEAIAEDRAAGLPRSASRPSPARPTPARSTTGRGWRTWPSGRISGSTWTPRTAARHACRRATPAASPVSSGPTRSRSTRTSGSSRPYDIGALFVQRQEDLRTRSTGSPSTTGSTRPEDEPLHWYQFSLEGTRRFRALKLWISWKHLGTGGLRSADRAEPRPGRPPRRAARRERRLGTCIDPDLSVVCFRHVPAGSERADPAMLDAYQNGLQRALESAARAGSRRRRCAAGRTCAPAS